jgi:GMP synthase-like glutamine amidotransferase
MNIAILEAGAPPGRLEARYGSYGDMFRRLLGTAFSFEVFDVRGGALPAESGAGAYVITGSSSGVYDGEPWIEALKGFVRERAGDAPMLGVCFGHQVMAEALGGQVIKSPKGWGVGLQRYDITTKTPWMDGVDSIALPVSHQDQVVEIGPEARVLAGNAFNPFGMVDYPGLRAMSVQAHPEFDVEFAAALIESRRGQQFDDQTADAAIASLKTSNDSRRVAVWLRRFLNPAPQRTNPAGAATSKRP